MAQQLKAFATLPEGVGSIPSTSMMTVISVTPIAGNPMILASSGHVS